jgi:hypothetical protein
MIPLTPGTVAASSNIAATWAYEPTSVFILKLIGDVDRWIVAAIEVAEGAVSPAARLGFCPEINHPRWTSEPAVGRTPPRRAWHG